VIDDGEQLPLPLLSKSLYVTTALKYGFDVQSGAVLRHASKVTVREFAEVSSVEIEQ
jgi:hypothetical protein